MHASPLAHHFESLEKQTHAARLGMWLFLSTEILLFTALFAAYALYRFLYGEAFAESSRHLETWIGFVNTIVLVTSSFTVALGLDRATRGDGRGTAIFFALYFLITGLHGIHVVIGMTVLIVVGVMAYRGRFTAEYHTPVELAGLYWHLVDLIWIFVFPLIYLI